MAKRKRPRLSPGEHRTHLCRFSTLDDLPAKQRSDPLAVLRLLAQTGRFSCFEVDGRLAGALTCLQGDGWAILEPMDYPWTRVTLTEAGEAELTKAEPRGD